MQRGQPQRMGCGQSLATQPVHHLRKRVAHCGPDGGIRHHGPCCRERLKNKFHAVTLHLDAEWGSRSFPNRRANSLATQQVAKFCERMRLDDIRIFRCLGLQFNYRP